MIRTIIQIDSERCNGCGACAAACHEGAIAMVDGKARLMREDYCDGLGDCLPACPTGAICFVQREAPAYDAEAVAAARAAASLPGCPGQQQRRLRPQQASQIAAQPSQLGQWPCQIKLAPVHAPYFSCARLLVAADCTAYAYANFHQDFMAEHITLIGCPKLDGIDYSEKLAAILGGNEIISLTVVRMEVPCCGGLELAVKKALAAAGKAIPCQVVTLSIDGRILDRKELDHV